ncbi:hypothetical protein [Alphaentomopoxvirus acuprea]|uniref:Uncharacterized protein n=1 Tax=Alphaentomopoxvirus acuprea TaxID=62099 RepID=W6JIQ7_9POXV|nr:hypothetical protein BA82_gp088 [Anomala cuprea entomopoxvirus]BAO49448.1 hypothetical protein [Anomala cuprea entomopoxvirus]
MKSTLTIIKSYSIIDSVFEDISNIINIYGTTKFIIFIDFINIMVIEKNGNYIFRNGNEYTYESYNNLLNNNKKLMGFYILNSYNNDPYEIQNIMDSLGIDTSIFLDINIINKNINNSAYTINHSYLLTPKCIDVTHNEIINNFMNNNYTNIIKNTSKFNVMTFYITANINEIIRSLLNNNIHLELYYYPLKKDELFLLESKDQTEYCNAIKSKINYTVDTIKNANKNSKITDICK